MVVRFLLGCVLLVLAAGTADAKEYSARRFDVSIRVLDGGTLDVTETLVFQFEDGTFSYVTREIPLRRTDGIEIISASMDGREMPRGDGAGQVEVTRKSRVRVRWRFEPTAHSTHTFVLKYLARGVVYQEDGADLLAWQALPRERGYRIASSAIELTLPARPLQRPAVLTRRLRAAQLDEDGDRLRVTAQELRSNGSVQLQVRFPSGSVIAEPPHWQARQRRAAARAPQWFAAAGLVLAAALVVIFALRQNYDTPPRDLYAPPATAAPPDTLPAPVAGALATDGQPRTEHAMAAVITLADRGDITIAAAPRGFLGQRDFTLSHARGAAPLAGYEQAVIETVFGARDGLHETVKLSAAMSRLALRSRRFGRAMQQHLSERGFLDEGRKAVRDRYAYVAWVLLALAAVAFVASLAFLRQEHGAWPLVIPAALLIGATIAGIVHHATTALSNEGLRRAAAWRAYRRHLRSAARERAPLAGNIAQLLPFAVAFGLASVWAKYAEHTAAAVPAWFQAAAADPRAFTAFVAASGHGTAGGGGAAGGGSSSAG
jgi:Predicted membrane protein (DUF2207)